MSYRLKSYHTILSLQFISVLCFSISVPPVYLTSGYIQAASNKVINGDLCGCTKGSADRPIANIPFSSAFTTSPHLGYGISGY